VPDSAISLTINSPTGRTQNHFHIHISCLRPDVREKLNAHRAISTQWLPFPAGWKGMNIWRAGDGERTGPAQPVYDAGGRAAGSARPYGALCAGDGAAVDGSFVLLATERNLLMLNRASAEELQDHQCAILN
jgi:CDP-diacylglycerol pyrophosphatase